MGAMRLCVVSLALVVSALSVPIRQSPETLCDAQDNFVRIADEENCIKYFQCYSGRAYLMQCPDFTWFNSDEQICDEGIPPTGCEVAEPPSGPPGHPEEPAHPEESPPSEEEESPIPEEDQPEQLPPPEEENEDAGVPEEPAEPEELPSLEEEESPIPEEDQPEQSPLPEGENEDAGLPEEPEQPEELPPPEEESPIPEEDQPEQLPPPEEENEDNQLQIPDNQLDSQDPDAIEIEESNTPQENEQEHNMQDHEPELLDDSTPTLVEDIFEDGQNEEPVDTYPDHNWEEGSGEPQTEEHSTGANDIIEEGSGFYNIRNYIMRRLGQDNSFDSETEESTTVDSSKESGRLENLQKYFSNIFGKDSTGNTEANNFINDFTETEDTLSVTDTIKDFPESHELDLELDELIILNDHHNHIEEPTIDPAFILPDPEAKFK